MSGEAPTIKANADIVLNGVPSYHDGQSDWRDWPPLDWRYGKTYPCQGVVISGGFHAPTQNGSAILAISVDGLQLTANAHGGGTDNNVSLLETGADSELFSVTNVRIANSTISVTKISRPCLQKY